MALVVPALLAAILPQVIGMAVGIAIGPALQQSFNRLIPIQAPSPDILIRLLFRELITRDQFNVLMKRHGFNETQAERVFQVSLFQPSPQDVVNWQAKEVLEPASVEKYGLDAEFEELDLELFRKTGVNEEQARNFWLAHWQHPPFNQVAEMLARDILTGAEDRDTVEAGSPEWAELRERGKQELFDWYRLVEIPPFWRDKLTKLSENLITRVDARRMYDMGVIGEERLLRMYLDLRYPEQEARDLTLWSKVNRDYPDLIQRYGNGWITSEEVFEELKALGMPEERAKTLLETRIQNLAKPQRVARERDLTKSEIVKGVKNGIISEDVGVELLVEMGYDEPEAQFIMAINIEAEGTPENQLELEWLVQGYRQSIGKDAKPIPIELIRLGRELRQSEALVVEAEQNRLPRDTVAGLTAEVGRLRERLRFAANQAGLLERLG